MSALLFLYREVPGVNLPWLDNINRPTRARRIPSVLTKDEVAGLLAGLEGETALLARFLYGMGMRLREGMRLRLRLRPRIKDVDFERHAIIVREAKGNKDRVVMPPPLSGAATGCERANVVLMNHAANRPAARKNTGVHA